MTTEIPITINPISITVPITIPAPTTIPISVGQTGVSAKIAKSYASVAIMMADTAPNGILVDQNAIIDSTDDDNGKLYRWDGDGVWTYLAQLRGPKGDTGQRFSYAKTYSSVAEMQADEPPAGVVNGDFVLIVSTVEDPDNAKVYLRSNDVWSFIVDTSGSQGAIGNPGEASYLYVQSREQQLITNCSGMLGTNQNFTSFTYDITEVSGCFGSFRINIAQGVRYNDEYLPVDPDSKYLLSGFGKSGDADGSNFNPANRQYLALDLYDIDNNNIRTYHSCKYSGSTDTTLAVQLNPGDTTVTLTNATGWANGSTYYQRNFGWWPFTNSKGYTWTQYTYTRNLSKNYVSGATTNGSWAQGGISSNVITLRAPWTGPALPAGTPVRNNPDESTYKYFTSCNYTIIPNTWTKYSGTIVPADGTGLEVPTQFRAGTVKAKLVFLINYHGAADNNVRWCKLKLSSLQAIT